MRVKLFPNFTRHHLITHMNISRVGFTKSFELEAIFRMIIYIQILVKIIVIFLLRCLKPLLPKFGLFVLSLAMTHAPMHRFFTRTDFVAVDLLILPCITLGPGGLFVFFWWQSWGSHD